MEDRVEEGEVSTQAQCVVSKLIRKRQQPIRAKADSVRSSPLLNSYLRNSLRREQASVRASLRQLLEKEWKRSAYHEITVNLP